MSCLEARVVSPQGSPATSPSAARIGKRSSSPWPTGLCIFASSRENLEDAGVRILAYCLMTNHIHMVAVPARADSLAVLFRRANGRYAQAMNIRRGRSGHLWQARFLSCPMAERHPGSACVMWNPILAGLGSQRDRRTTGIRAQLHICLGRGTFGRAGYGFLGALRRN